MNIDALFSAISELKHQAIQLDASRGENSGYLFDINLFHCKSHLLLPCVEELEQTARELQRYQYGRHEQAHHVEYLCDRLINQLSAIQREIGTQRLRKSETQTRTSNKKSISALYHDLNQHLGWERRLMEMLTDKLSEIDNAPQYKKGELQQAILTLEQRLLRCQQAKQKIENTITKAERNHRG